MSTDPIRVRAEHPAEWIAALPVLVGYQLHDRTVITFTATDGAMVCTAAMDNHATAGQLRDAFTRQAQPLRAAGAATTWTVVHDLDGPTARAHSRMLADTLAGAGLPRPDPAAQFAVDRNLAWPVTDGTPPAQVWFLDQHRAVRDRLELLFGAPTQDRDHVGADLVAQPGPLRTAITTALPAAAADPLAVEDPARWRVTAAADTLARLTDPQPWTGPDAARVLLALSDPRILTHLLTHLQHTTHGDLLTPDTGHLADLVRAAPPGLVAGPATLLAAGLTQRGMTTSRARVAAALALADRPDSTTALALMTGLHRGDRPDRLLADLTEHAPHLTHPAAVLFTTGDGHWPDPLAQPGLAAAPAPQPPPGHTPGRDGPTTGR